MYLDYYTFRKTAYIVITEMNFTVDDFFIYDQNRDRDFIRLVNAKFSSEKRRSYKNKDFNRFERELNHCINTFFAELRKKRILA